jgi:hypothetical protein
VETLSKNLDAEPSSKIFTITSSPRAAGLYSTLRRIPANTSNDTPRGSIKIRRRTESRGVTMDDKPVLDEDTSQKKHRGP